MLELPIRKIKLKRMSLEKYKTDGYEQRYDWDSNNCLKKT